MEYFFLVFVYIYKIMTEQEQEIERINDLITIVSVDTEIKFNIQQIFDRLSRDNVDDRIELRW